MKWRKARRSKARIPFQNLPEYVCKIPTPAEAPLPAALSGADCPLPPILWHKGTPPKTAEKEKYESLIRNFEEKCKRRKNNRQKSIVPLTFLRQICSESYFDSKNLGFRSTFARNPNFDKIDGKCEKRGGQREGTHSKTFHKKFVRS